MKLHEIIIEGKLPHRTSTTSMLEAIDFIKINCSEIVQRYKKNRKRIYRGIPTASYNDFFFFGNTDISKRKSRNTENYYTLIMDNSPIMKEFPKRSESFICSSDASYASNFGKLTIAFPVNGTKIGICPTSDLWDTSQKKYDKSFANINELITKLFSHFNIKKNENNYQHFRTSIEELQTKLSNKSNLNKIYDLYDSEFNFIQKMIKSKDLNKFFESVYLDYEFELQTTKNFNPPNNREMWFSGQCVFIYASERIHIGPEKASDYVKYLKAGGPKINRLSVDDIIKEI